MIKIQKKRKKKGKKEEGKEGKDKEGKDGKDGKEGKDKEGKDGKDGKEGKDKEGKEGKEGKDKEGKEGKEEKDKKKPKEEPQSPRVSANPHSDKFGVAYKIVELATEFARHCLEIQKSVDENKPKSLAKIGKKVVPGLLPKLLKPSPKDTEFDKRRQTSLGEFARVTEELKDLLIKTSSAAPPAGSKQTPIDPELTADIKQHVEEGHMFLSAVLQKELAMVVTLHNEDKKTVSATNLSKILTLAHSYCDDVSTMKFPDEWETLLEEVNPKYKKEKEKKLQDKNKSPDKREEKKRRQRQREEKGDSG